MWSRGLTHRLTIAALIAAFAFACVAHAGDSAGPTTRAAPAARAVESAPTTLPAPVIPAAIVTLKGEINDFARDSVIRHFGEAKKLGAKTIILQLNTPGGLVSSGLELSSFLKQQDDVHVIAYVDDMALSAGIMIGLAADEIVMEPGSMIGDSAPIALSPTGGLQTLGEAERAKAESPVLADFRDSAYKNGYDPLLAEAMVSFGKVVRWVEDPKGGERRFVDEPEFAKLTAAGWTEVNEPGVPRPVDSSTELLTVKSDAAVKLGLATGTAPSASALAAQRGLNVLATYSPGAGDRFIAWLGSDLVRFLLLTVFLQTLYIAFHAPGHGMAEVAALFTGGLLLGVPMLTGYATWWEIAAVVLGLGLLALELFVIPGFGVAGITGIVLILGGLIMTFVGNTPGVPGTWRMPSIWSGLQSGLMVVLGGLVCSLFLSLWIRRYLPKLPYFNRLILQPTGAARLATAGGPPTVENPADVWPFAGTVGRAVTDLKPGGSAEFPYGDDKRTTAVVSDSGFVSSGTKLQVREVHGNRVVVRPAT